MVPYTCSLQYEDSTCYTLYRFLLPLCRQVEFAPFLAATQIFTLSKVILGAFPYRFLSSIHPLRDVLFIEPTLFHKNPSSYLRFPHISVGNFQLLSPRLRQCTLVPRSHLLLILLGSFSVPSRFSLGSFFLLVPISALCRLDAIHLSQCRLLCPCVPSADVCVTVLDISVISSFSLSAVFPLHLFNTYVESMLSMQLYSFFVPSSLLSPSLHPFILSRSR